MPYFDRTGVFTMTSRITADRHSHPGAWVIPGAGIAVLGVAIHSLYPGWYTFDSAYLLYQARTGTYSDLQPPLLAVLWGRLIDLGASPGSLLIAHLGAYTAGSVMLGLAVRSVAGCVFPILLLWPPFLAVFGHLWIDVSLAASLVFASGWIAWTRSRGRVYLSWLASLALIYAVCVRHNAIFAVPPFYFLLVSQTPALPQRTFPRIALVALLTLGSFGLSVVLSKAVVEKSVPAWSPTAIWDLSSASVTSGQMLLPTGVRGPTMVIEELRPLMNPHESVSLLTSTKSGINAGIVEPLPSDVRRELLFRWVSLPFTHTQAWLLHRRDVTRSLFGRQVPDKADALFIEPGVVQFRDNPLIERNESSANAIVLAAARSMRSTLWCAPVVYLLLSIAAIGLTFRPAFSRDRDLVWCLFASAWGFALPLAVLVPSTDWRYLLWPMLSAVLAFAFALAGTRAGDQ